RAGAAAGVRDRRERSDAAGTTVVPGRPRDASEVGRTWAGAARDGPRPGPSRRGRPAGRPRDDEPAERRAVCALRVVAGRVRGRRHTAGLGHAPLRAPWRLPVRLTLHAE